MTINRKEPRIRFHKPLIGEEEIAEVTEVLRSGWLTTGPRTAQFENELRAYVGASHALAVNSCTAGLHLALAALGIGAGDEVITTPLTFCATVNTIIHVGATPRLADVLPNGNIDPAALEACITPRTKAVMPVHLGGAPCDMDRIWSIASRYGLRVIEDAAHALGARYHDRPIGYGNDGNTARSDAVVYSFYATKNITTGEGGMVVCHDQDLLERMRRLCLHGISKDAWGRYSAQGSWYYEVVETGFKYNLSDIHSAIGIHQLRKLDSFIETRRRLAGIYAAELASSAEIELPSEEPGTSHAWHLYQVRLRLERLTIDRDTFIESLREMGIQASVHFIPIPAHPFFERSKAEGQRDCPLANEFYRRSVSLPLYPGMTDEEVAEVARITRSVLNAARKPLAAAAAV